MDIAIQFEKINIGINTDRFLFRPISAIRGQYLEDDNYFVSECGVVCEAINGDEPDAEFYFSHVTTLEDLEKHYEDTPEDDLLIKYLEDCMEFCYLGIYNEETNHIDTIAISFDSIIEMYNSAVELDNQNDSGSKAVLNSTTEENSATPKKTSNNSKLKLQENKVNNYNLKRIRKKVLSNIIAQDDAVNTVTTALVVNYKSKNPRHKSHILIAGPSGTGKTEMINIVANQLGVPCFKADATAYTKEGYVGKSVYSMLLGLIEAAGGDIKKAQNGILVVDEIDKKAHGTKDDVGGQAVLNSLLKIMDRGVIEVDLGGLFGGTVNFDTTNLTIIFMGAFADIYENKEKNRKIGFGINSNESEISNLTNEDFIKYGMPAEFMGRIGTIAYTNEFSIENLVELLYKSKISPLKEEREFFKDLGVKVTFTSDYVKEIANKSKNSKTGARDLKRLVKQSLKYAYDDVLTRKDVKILKLTKETVMDPKKYYIK